MKLSEIKGEVALDVLADIIDPLGEIIGDKEIEAAYKKKSSYKDLIKMAIKRHKKAVIEIMARLDLKSPEEYEVDFLTLPRKIMEVLSDPNLSSLFSLRSEITESNSGSATGNIEAKEA